MTISFTPIRARAEARKGGAEALAKLLTPVPDRAKLTALTDDRVLSAMTRLVFSAGFVWRVIEAKWDGFEAAFMGFEPGLLLFQPDEFWWDLAEDTRIIRNGQKIMAARANAAFVCEIAEAHGSFGAFLAGWPSTDQIGLAALLAKRGSRLGGTTGHYLLRTLGWDVFVLSRDGVAALRHAGLDVAAHPTSKRDLAKVQAQFTQWAEETGLPYAHLSRIAAMSMGDNRDGAGDELD